MKWVSDRTRSKSERCRSAPIPIASFPALIPVTSVPATAWASGPGCSPSRGSLRTKASIPGSRSSRRCGKSSGPGVRGRRARAKQAELEALARQRGVADRVRFLTAVADADLPALYNGAALYLGLSRPEELLIEGFGISLTEASACGIPRGRRARPAAFRTPSGMARPASWWTRRIRSRSSPPSSLLLADPALRARLGQAGRRAVESHYNWDRVTRDVRRLGQDFGVPGPTR